MRHACSYALALVLVPMAGSAHAQAEPDLRIAEILPDPDALAGQREFVELWNAGSAPLDLEGWRITDAPTAGGAVDTFVFPAWRLGPGQRVVVWGGGAADGTGPAWSDATVWNNAGDGVHLRAPDGTLVDYLGYGATTPPADATLQPRPARGQALYLEGGAWNLGAPTPGTAPGAIGGSLAFVVENAAPTLLWAKLPAAVRHGAQVEVVVSVQDPNGASDLRSWALHAGGVEAAQGTLAGSHAVTLVAPTSGTELLLRATAQDAAGATANLTAAIALRASDLGVAFPDGPVRFSAPPGAGHALAVGRIRLDNAGDRAITPLLDVSPFRAGDHAIAPEGRLLVGWNAGDAIGWHPYNGPLTALADLPPGASLDLEFRLESIPAPLPAGSYGASFTVVPA